MPHVKVLCMEELRVTLAVAQVLGELLEDIATPRYGYELMRQTGFGSGKMYPILARLERAGWLTRQREPVDPAATGRPARRNYRLTPEGARAARLELAHLRQRLNRGTQRLAAG